MSSFLKCRSKNIYFIGGSPCSGKSTITTMLAENYGFYYFKVDELLDDYINKGKLKGKPICTKQSNMTSDEIWMRAPEIQNLEELQFYREIFEFIITDLSNINSDIVTEGASYLPELMRKIGIDKKHYINITPTFDFQYAYYKERPWVPYVIRDCHDKEKAFDNWMKRDAFFAGHVRNQSRKLGYKTLITDETVSCINTYQIVCNLFGLEE